MARELAAVLARWDELNQRRATRDGFVLPPPVVETGTALRPGAGDDALAALERRLGVSLPPSYRAFLLLSDGAYAQPGWGFPGLPVATSDPDEQRALGLLDTEQVGWFRDREPQYHDVWGFEVFLVLDSLAHPYFARRVPECEYLDHERAQDPENAKDGHVRYALQVSSDVDGYTILLNPLVVDAGHEWEAWDFGHKHVGAVRHRSFLELLAADVRMASRSEPTARAATVAILTAPGVEDWVIRSVPFTGKDAAWEAWSSTGDRRLLVQAAACVDERAVDAIVAAVQDSSVPGEIRADLVTYVWWQRDPAVLVRAAELPDAPLVPLGRALLRLGATEDGVTVLGRALETPWWRMAAEELGRLGSDSAFEALLERFRREPAAELAHALGWYGDPRASEALLAAAEQPGLRLAVVDGLEKVRGRHALDALARLSARGDLLAARALARLGDERALAPLLAALASADPEIAFEGADGLRDLRSPASAMARLSTVERGGDDDVLACTAHALVAIGAQEAEAALGVLAESGSPQLRRLAEIWARA